jgi:hypothetical protein
LIHINPKTTVMFKRTLIIGIFSIALVAWACAPKNSAPNEGSGDCYNRVTETCNGKHPGKDLGDSVYRDCINGGLDWCDVNEPNTNPPLPTLNTFGRFEIKAKAID